MFRCREKERDFASLSLGESVVVCGVKIAKMPLGAYIAALGKLAGLTDIVIASCFEGKTFGEILGVLTEATDCELAEMAGVVLRDAPAALIEVFAELIGVDADWLVNDAGVGLDGLCDMVRAFVRVNGLKKNMLTILS